MKVAQLAGPYDSHKFPSLAIKWLFHHNMFICTWYLESSLYNSWWRNPPLYSCQMRYPFLKWIAHYGPLSTIMVTNMFKHFGAHCTIMITDISEHSGAVKPVLLVVNKFRVFMFPHWMPGHVTSCLSMHWRSISIFKQSIVIHEYIFSCIFPSNKAFFFYWSLLYSCHCYKFSISKYKRLTDAHFDACSGFKCNNIIKSIL